MVYVSVEVHIVLNLFYEIVYKKIVVLLKDFYFDFPWMAFTCELVIHKVKACCDLEAPKDIY